MSFIAAMTETTVFSARKILTMNPSCPEATHVAVRDGRILGVGSLAELSGWGTHTLDERFADKVLMPGLIEGHSHLMAGTLWRYVYCGYFDCTDPDGRVWPGAKSLEDVIAALKGAADADALCNMSKLFASEEIMKIAQHAMELHGGNGAMLDFGIEKLFRDASIFLHMDATADISRLKIVKSLFPLTAGKYAGKEE